jgi:hypothetical protein
MRHLQALELSTVHHRTSIHMLRNKQGALRKAVNRDDAYTRGAERESRSDEAGQIDQWPTAPLVDINIDTAASWPI